eukprot:CAMPEP_0201525334 /NCGR_PEP_ID=MMETSP0161_2-20130828/27749_1 /ASSEMBLY_ACC=CAM_ASM_000251 /TAXON_ID=180227 /ORGANISM="Neoparamoeba aestuarina, Strain SoJaBio B1-5/56/2" /LENGTH=306 /DNA_ID=CAMNT_0047925199 /DNA_START=213 /DNA_END=1130 /DNA_ORIENTATION=-
MQCQGENGKDGWKQVADTFNADVYYDDFTYDVVGCAGVNDMLYYITPDFPHVLLGFDLKAGGKQVLKTQCDKSMDMPFWMLQYPPQPDLFLVMANYKYGTLDSKTGNFTVLYDMMDGWEATGQRQRSLSKDNSTIWFEGFYAWRDYANICVNICMLGLDPLTGDVLQVQPMIVEPTYIASSALPPAPKQPHNESDFFPSVFVSVSDPSHSLFQSGAVGLPYDVVVPEAPFAGPLTYIPQGDFDVYDGKFGQFYYVTNASFVSSQKFYRQIDMETGNQVLVLPIADDVVPSSLCEQQEFTTSSVVYV